MSQNRKVLLDLIGEMKDNDKPVSFLGAKVSSPADLAQRLQKLSALPVTKHFIISLQKMEK